MLRRRSLAYHECLSSNYAIVGGEGLHKYWSLHLIFAIVSRDQSLFLFSQYFFHFFSRPLKFCPDHFPSSLHRAVSIGSPKRSSISHPILALLSLNVLPPKPFTSFTPATLSFPFLALRPRFRPTLRREKRKKQRTSVAMSDNVDDRDAPWFPENKLEWRLDVVTLLAVIGEASMAEHSQAITASLL